MNEYSTASWHAFRNEVIRLGGHVCAQCGKRQADGDVLQVQHKQYVAGRSPWDYTLDQCAPLCKGCLAIEHGLVPPKFGWEFFGYDDLGEVEGTCEHCETGIRYVFLIQHPNWRALEVGTDCCDNLTCTQAASDHIESLRRHQERLRRFMSSIRWRVDAAGVHMIRQKKVDLYLVPQGDAYKLRVDWELGKNVFPSLFHAKAAAFELVESGKLEAWLEKRRQRQYEQARERRDPFDIAPGGARRR